MPQIEFYASKYRINHIINNIRNGNWLCAKVYIQRGCKTKPEKQAYRLAQVVSALIENEKSPDAAARLMNMFDTE